VLGRGDAPGMTTAARSGVIPEHWPRRGCVSHSSWHDYHFDVSKRRLLRSSALVLVLVGIGGVSYFLADKHGLERLRIERVTPDQIARAMKDDRFFADYRERTLLVTGTVVSVTGDAGGEIVRFGTTSRFAALCDLRDSAPQAHRGRQLTVIAEGATAERQSAAVVLRNCRLP
jgi:hypothetical protein